MRSINKNKIKRVGAALLALLLWASNMPYVTFETSYAEENIVADVTVSGNVTSCEEYLITVGQLDHGSYNLYSQDKAVEDGVVLGGESAYLVIKPEHGYKIETVTITMDGEEWNPAGVDDWWVDYIDGYNGYFGLTFEEVSANYHVEVVFTEKQYVFTYTIDSNGTLVLNSKQTDNQIVVVGPVENQTTEVASSQNEYWINATVTNANYHLSSFQVNGKEVLSQDVINNDLHSQEYLCWNVNESTQHLCIETAIDAYGVTVAKDGRGDVQIVDEATGATYKKVAHGSDVTIRAVPRADYQVAYFQVNGADLATTQCTIDENGYYCYTISGITEDQFVEVFFEKIPKRYLLVEDSGLIVKDQNAQVHKINPNEKKCAEKFTLSMGNKIQLSLSTSYKYQDEISITNSQDIYHLYIRDNTHNAFGTELEYIFLSPLQLIIDDRTPEIELTAEQQQIWAKSSQDKVVLKGKVKDDNIDRVVWSTQILEEDEILAEVNQVVNKFKDSKFEISGVPLNKTNDTDTFYLYAVDKAGHYSAPYEVIVYTDGLAPVVTDVLVQASTLNKQKYGNFTNSALQLTITTNDIKSHGNHKSNASGISELAVYAGESENPVYTTKNAQVNKNTENVEFVITIPVGEAEAFADLKDVFIKVTDAMGNVSGEYKIADFANAEVTSNQFMLEQDVPDIEIKKVTEGAYIKQTDNGAQYWYKDIPEVHYWASDMRGENKGSGLADRQISLNGNVIEQCTKDDYALVDSYEEVVQIENSTVSSGDLSEMVLGENQLEITFTDLAGNTFSQNQTLYLDNHAPEITGFSINKTENLSRTSADSGYAFGNFYNGMVQIVIAAEDAQDEEGATIATAGLQTITLYLDGVEYGTKEVNNQGEVTFLLPSELILDEEKIYLDAVITATATDMVNNESEIFDMTTGNSNILSSQLMIETVKPTMSILVDENAYIAENGVAYVNTNTNLGVDVADIGSGLRDVVVEINGDVLVALDYPADATEKVLEDSFTVSTGNAVADANNLYEMTVVAVDNAGNEQTAAQKVFKDVTAPKITQIDMLADGMIEADGDVSPVTERDYGYYFKEDTLVIIYATDGSAEADSGVKEIQYYTTDYKGNKSETKTVAVDENNSISFMIEEGFKGQIYACAYDMLMNAEEGFVTPQALLIETAEQHASEEHITLTKAEPSYSTADGGELYAEDVDVTLTIIDTFSGIRDVEWTVDAPYDTAANQSGKVTVNNQGQFTADSNAEGWAIDAIDKNLVTKMHKTLRVSNNSNDIVVKAKMTDRTGYVAEQEIKFSIDKSKPVIEISFDDIVADSEFSDMYRENRTATITVKERNFTADAITTTIANSDGSVPPISEWSTSTNNENPDETLNTATVVFSEDGDYTMEVSGHDAAKNASETVNVTPFTIDKTLPVIAVNYDNNNALNGNYFAQTRVATISITEHNFIDQRVSVIGTATLGGSDIAFPSISGWSQNGDVYTTSIVYEADGLYQFDVECLDKAGNAAERYTGESFHVDKTEPVVEILGVENESANNGTVAPKVSLTDLNYDANGISIELVGANQGAVSMDGGFIAQANGQLFSFVDFPALQVHDDIYTLNAQLRDMAGNESTQSITFSVNRFGSVYVLDNSLKAIAGTYVKEPIDAKLTEVNVDSLEHDTIKVVVDANGTPRDLEEGTDYYVQETGGNGSWYQYDYTIKSSVFAGDGRYIVTLYSQDMAGNVNENIDESKKAEISFGVDQTAPVVIPIDIESNTQYPVDVKEATVTVNDNLVLESVEIYVGAEQCEYTVNGENYTFSIPGADEPQEITIVAMDLAGNKTSHVVSDVLVTTNAFVRWYNNKPLVAGTVAGATVVSGGGIGVGALLRRRKFLVV